MIIRERYLKLIRPFYDQDLIKVLIEIRRSGKSVLLTQIIDELKLKGISDQHIVYINFEDFDYAEYTEPKKLHNFIKEQIIDDEKYYIFFDELTNALPSIQGMAFNIVLDGEVNG
ncbi:MAG TPA: AAA family ATPase, partial [Candidatus Onthocola stercoravium]|nr:AAA family ATPase [Candidatus Onthocola stercoravium]